MSFSGLLSELSDLILTANVAIAIGSILLIWISFKLYLRISRHLKRKSYPPDIVILHQANNIHILYSPSIIILLIYIEIFSFHEQKEFRGKLYFILKHRLY